MIRELRKEDLYLFKELSTMYKTNFYELYNVDNIFDNKIERVFVYEDKYDLKGFILIEKCFETLSILHLFVSPDYRKQRIGSLLLDYVLSDTGIQNVILEVDVNNEPAINLYKKFDFKIINTRKKYYGQTDAYVMEKKVQNEIYQDISN